MLGRLSSIYYGCCANQYLIMYPLSMNENSIVYNSTGSYRRKLFSNSFVCMNEFKHRTQSFLLLYMVYLFFV